MAYAFRKGSFLASGTTGNQVVSVPTGGNWPASTTGKLVRFFATNQTAGDTASAGAGGCMGAAASATSRWAHSWHTDQPATATNAGQWSRTTACIILLSNGTPTIVGVADFVSFGVDQFTVNWTTAAPANTIIHYTIEGGDLTNAFCGSGSIPVTASTVAYATGGFVPDCVEFVPPYLGTDVAAATDSHTNIGFATRLPTTLQTCIQYFDNEANTMDCQISTSTTHCISVCLNATDTTPALASLSLWSATDGFSLAWTQTYTTAGRFFFIARKGGSYKTGVETEATTNVARPTTGVGFAPRGLIAASTGQTADGQLTSAMPNLTAMFALGATDGTNEGAFTNIQMDGHADSQARRWTSLTRFLTLQKYTSSTLTAGNVATFATSGQADAALNADGFTLTWSSTDGTARRFIYLALGEAAGGDATLTAQVAAATAASPNATLTAGGLFTAAAATAAAMSPASTFAGGALLAASTGTATATSPNATLSAAGTATLSAQVASATASSPNGALTAGSVLAGAAAPASASSPSAVLTASSVLAGAVAAATAQSPTAAVHGAAALLAALTTATAASPASTWTANSVLTAVVVSATATSPNATLSAASAVTKVVRMTLRTRNRSLTLAAIDTSLTLPTRARRP